MDSGTRGAGNGATCGCAEDDSGVGRAAARSRMRSQRMWVVAEAVLVRRCPP